MDSARSPAGSRARSSPRDRRAARSPPPRRPPCPRRPGRGRGGRGRSAALAPRSAQSCGRPVSAATELTVALKISFDHCAGSRSGSASTCRPGARDQRGEPPATSVERRVLVGAEPRLRVEHVLDVRVRVARPAHERDARDDRPVAGARTTSSAPRPFRTVMIVASGKRPARERAAASSPAALVATMPRSNAGAPRDRRRRARDR